MNTVEPIRDLDIVAKIKWDLKESSPRNYALFVLGINTALRISDLLSLKVGQMRKQVLYIRTSKNGKEITLPISEYLRRELKPIMEGKGDHEFLFTSRQIKRRTRIRKQIDRSVAYRLLSRLGKKYGLEHIGTHSLRKTFAYHHYKKEKNVAALMDLLGHADPSYTLRYIGIAQDDINKSVKGWHL